MAFFLGLIVSMLLIVCVSLEMAGCVRWLFSLIFLGGIFGLTFIIFKAGLLLTPFFIAGLMVNFIFFIIMLPVIITGSDKEKKDGKRGN